MRLSVEIGACGIVVVVRVWELHLLCLRTYVHCEGEGRRHGGAAPPQRCTAVDGYCRAPCSSCSCTSSSALLPCPAQCGGRGHSRLLLLRPRFHNRLVRILPNASVCFHNLHCWNGDCFTTFDQCELIAFCNNGICLIAASEYAVNLSMSTFWKLPNSNPAQLFGVSYGNCSDCLLYKISAALHSECRMTFCRAAEILTRTDILHTHLQHPYNFHTCLVCILLNAPVYASLLN